MTAEEAYEIMEEVRQDVEDFNETMNEVVQFIEFYTQNAQTLGEGLLGFGLVMVGSGIEATPYLVAIFSGGTAAAPAIVLAPAAHAVSGTLVATGTVLMAKSFREGMDEMDRSERSSDRSSSSSSSKGTNNLDTDSWNKGSFDTPEQSLEYHFNKHGAEVKAKDIHQYLRKAQEFAKQLRGAKKFNVRGAIDGVTRYIKNGRYIDLAPDGTIISFGKR